MAATKKQAKTKRQLKVPARRTAKKPPQPVQATQVQKSNALGKDIAYIGLALIILGFVIITALTVASNCVSSTSNAAVCNTYADLTDVFLSLIFPFAAFSYMYYKGMDTSNIVRSIGLTRDKLTPYMIVLGIALFVIIFLLEILTAVISQVTGTVINSNVGMVLGGAPLWLLFFVTFIGPLDEEIFFRGFAVPRIGIVLSALIFGLLHYGYGSTFGIEIIAAFIFGLLAGYVFKKTGSLYPSLTAHILVNLLAASALAFIHL